MTTKTTIQQDALTAIGNYRKAGIAVSMGVGKTLLGLKHMSKFFNNDMSYLIVAPKVAIFESWRKEIADYDYKYLLDHVTVVTYRSLTKLNPEDFDIIYLDECHSLKYTHKDWLLSAEKAGARFLGLTGTYPVYKNTEKGKMCRYFCPKLYEYNTDNAVEDKILNDYRIFIHQLKLDPLPTISVHNPKGDDFVTSEVKSYDYWNRRVFGAETAQQQQITRIQRMKALMSFPSKEIYASHLLAQATKKTIIFANTQQQADNLCEHSYHSNNPESQDNLNLFNDGTIMKLSAVEQLSEGITIPNLETGIIMHSYSNNKRASQKIGRLLRLDPDTTAKIHILCYVDTVDKEWVTKALAHLDQSKISWVQPMHVNK